LRAPNEFVGDARCRKSRGTATPMTIGPLKVSNVNKAMAVLVPFHAGEFRKVLTAGSYSFS